MAAVGGTNDGMGARVLGSSAFLAVVIAIGCATTPRGASDASLALARSKVPAGAEVYQRECADCHGSRGDGRGNAPELMGAGALPKYRRIESFGSNASYSPIAQQGVTDPARTMYQGSRPAFVSAQDLFDYASTHMPLPSTKAGTLKQEEYWAIVNFLLTANGVKLPPEGVIPANAKSIAIQH